MKYIYVIQTFFLLNLSCSFAQVGSEQRTPKTPPSTSVQIVNATSVPSISLEVNGLMHYPDFPQGKFTADAPTEGLTYKYKVTNKSDGTIVIADVITYKNQENQTLLLMGDFTRESPDGKMPQPFSRSQESDSDVKIPPNLVLRVYSHQDDQNKKPICIRIINGMPRKILKIKSPDTKPDVELLPGDEIQFEGQPLVQNYSFSVDGKPLVVPIRQDSNAINANIVFFLKNNEPAFVRFFQSTGQKVEEEEN